MNPVWEDGSSRPQPSSWLAPVAGVGMGVDAYGACADLSDVTGRVCMEWGVSGLGVYRCKNVVQPQSELI